MRPNLGIMLGLIPALSGKVRAATKAKPAIVNAAHAFYHGEDLGTECPDHNITKHTSTGLRYCSFGFAKIEGL